MGDYSELSVDDLKAMILGLKMASFSYINDEDLLTSITCLISDLPTPESLTCDNCDIKSVTERMGYIMSLIEKGGCKNKASEARHESKTGMPPRYCLVNSNKDNKMKKEAADKLVAELLEISNIADSEELYDVSDNALSIAESIVEGKNVSADSVDKLIKQCESNSKLVKLAQDRNWGQRLRDMNPFSGGAKQTRNQRQTDAQTLNRLNEIKKLNEAEYYDTGKMVQILKAIPNKQVSQYLEGYVNYIGKLEKAFAGYVDELINNTDIMINQYNQSGQFLTQENLQGMQQDTDEEAAQEQGVAQEQPQQPQQDTLTEEQKIGMISKSNYDQLYRYLANNTDRRTRWELDQDGWDNILLKELNANQWLNLFKHLNIDRDVIMQTLPTTAKSSQKWIKIN
jgi:hypothetical protein